MREQKSDKFCVRGFKNLYPEVKEGRVEIYSFGVLHEKLHAEGKE